MSENPIEPSQDTSGYSYDTIPYPSYPFDATHPDHIYTLARLFNIEAKLPDEAAILELGGASGGNLIPMAVQMPNAKFVGVDLSVRQIAEGQAMIERLGLKNIQLLARDFQDIDDSFGKFDYILCHGVFSWVPPAAQNRILELCHERLTRNGIAYVSYNAYPGWFMRGMIRQMMLHHTRQLLNPVEKIKQSRALISFLVDSTEGQTTPHAQVLRQELEMLSRQSDAYLFHEHLEDNNHPMFFYQFMELAEANKLQFVGESSLASMVTSNLPPKAAEALTRLTNNLNHRSQYTDFVTNRMFRQSLLCHADVPVNRNLDEQRIAGARFAGSIRVETTDHDLSNEVEMDFKFANGRQLQLKSSVHKALLLTLAEAWPVSLTAAEIAERVNKRLSELLVVGEQEASPTEKIVAANMLQMLARGDIDIRFVPDRFAADIPEKPATSGLARLQAASAGPITTLRHRTVNLDPPIRLLIQSVDGTKTREDLAQAVADLAAAGQLTISIKGEQPVDMETVSTATVNMLLEQLRKAALLLPAKT